MIENSAPNLMLGTSDREERKRRARMAAYVFLWFLDDITNGVPENGKEGNP
jgi:hypothetical protein